MATECSDAWRIASSKPISAPPQRRFDLAWSEDLLAAGVFLVALLAFRGLYGVVPFLLALAIGGLAAAAAVVLFRLMRRNEVSFGKRTLKTAGHWTGRGRAAIASPTPLGLLQAPILVRRLVSPRFSQQCRVSTRCRGR